MIRRIFQNIRRQDWTAVVIELVVVILGVFIGVQVSNWNGDLETDRKSALFTSRLKADLREEAWGYELQVGYYEQVRRNAIAAEDALAGRASLSDEALLIAAYRATQYNAYIRRRATYDELTSTGEIGLIRDTALRELAMHTYTAEVFSEVIDKGRSSEFRIAFRKAIARDVQTTLNDRCGDHIVAIGDYAAIEQVLDYRMHDDAAGGGDRGERRDHSRRSELRCRTAASHRRSRHGPRQPHVVLQGRPARPAARIGEGSAVRSVDVKQPRPDLCGRWRRERDSNPR